MVINIMFTQLRRPQGLRLDGTRRDHTNQRDRPCCPVSTLVYERTENGKWWSLICHHSRIARIQVRHFTCKNVQKGQRTLVRTLQLKFGDSRLGECKFYSRLYSAYPPAISGASLDSAAEAQQIWHKFRARKLHRGKIPLGILAASLPPLTPLPQQRSQVRQARQALVLFLFSGSPQEPRRNSRSALSPLPRKGRIQVPQSRCSRILRNFCLFFISTKPAKTGPENLETPAYLLGQLTTTNQGARRALSTVHLLRPAGNQTSRSVSGTRWKAANLSNKRPNSSSCSTTGWGLSFLDTSCDSTTCPVVNGRTNQKPVPGRPSVSVQLTGM